VVEKRSAKGGDAVADAITVDIKYGLSAMARGLSNWI